jgi:hypothetical protein
MALLEIFRLPHVVISRGPVAKAILSAKNCFALAALLLTGLVITISSFYSLVSLFMTAGHNNCVGCHPQDMAATPLPEVLRSLGVFTLVEISLMQTHRDRSRDSDQSESTNSAPL